VNAVNIDWDAVESDYRRGRLSLREMAAKHSCSHSSIANRARRSGWTRLDAAQAAVGVVSELEGIVAGAPAKEMAIAALIACVHLMITLD